MNSLDGLNSFIESKKHLGNLEQLQKSIQHQLSLMPEE